MGKTVVAAMSGGVDSSVAAALLLEQGYRVIGITMNVWPEEESAGARSCCSVTDIDDARAVCAKLGIPHYTLNMREIFQKQVIDYFLAEYLRGRTPNPCIACNAHVKFEALLRRAEELGADFIATGHYARVTRDSLTGGCRLTRSADPRKDQTYVLYMLDEQRLAHVLLPCGGFQKPEIREIARAHGLPTYHKPDSQDLCFIGAGGYAGFIRENCGELARSGPIIGPGGEVLGTHDGVFHYTVGQHRGLGGGLPGKLFVTRIDPARAAVYVGPESELFRPAMRVEDLHPAFAGALADGARVGVKIRYSAPETAATLHALPDGALRVDFDSPQRAITPGQAAVFYGGDTVLGGGTIAGTL